MIEHVGSACDGLEVIVFMPHLDPDCLTIGIDTPEGRTWEISEAGALELAALLPKACLALTAARRRLEEEEGADDVEDDA